jgi:epoxide hydrolase-like predicted phosphatase
MAAKLRAVLWDYGGVFSGSPFHAMAGVAQNQGVAPQRYLEIVFGPYDHDTDHPWHRLERGELTLEVARAEIIALGRHAGIDSDPFHLFGAMGGGGMRADVIEFARGVRRGGVATALVTNNAVEFRDFWRRSIPVDELFDQVIDSSEVGIRKPNPRIFELALERLGGIDPAAAVFVDDWPGNVEAARRVGLHGVLVTQDYAAALSELRSLIEFEEFESR